ncbi:N-acetylmuramoyl-L-alanine amidase [Paenibacillus marinisediminis]
MKTSVWLLCIMLFLIVWPQAGHAAAGQNLYMNGNSISLPEPMRTINSSSMIPIRVVSEELGYKVDWEQKTRTVNIHNGSTDIKLVVDKSEALLNGKQVKMSTPPTVINNTTLVPLRFVGESMGLVVEWDKDTKAVYLFTPDDEKVVTPPPSGSAGGSGSGQGTEPTKPPSSGSGNNTNEGSGEVSKPDNKVDGNVVDFAFFDNTLHISMDKPAAAKIQVMTNPDRVVIDLPNTVFSKEFMNKYEFDKSSQGSLEVAEYPDVQRIRYAMFAQSPNTVRFVVDGNYALSYENISTSDDLISIMFAPKSEGVPPEYVKPKGKYTVVIDPGHGGGDSGAVSVRNRYEKDLNLAIASKVAELAKNEPKLNVVLTRDTDVYPKLSERAAFANKIEADLFVSIHGNSVDKNPNVNGTETYFNRADSKALAEVMHKHLLVGTQFVDRKVKQADHKVTRETVMPAILLEVGFLTNEKEEMIMFDEAFQWRVAEQIIAGLKEYLGIS